MTFKYKDTIITTPNLEKKLKRMGIQLSDIEIIEEVPIIKKETGIEDYMKDKERVIVRSTRDNIRRVCYVLKGTRPPFKKLFENQRWNPITKTGIRDMTDDYMKTMYYE